MMRSSSISSLLRQNVLQKERKIRISCNSNIGVWRCTKRNYRTIWTWIEDWIRSTDLTDRMYYDWKDKKAILKENPIIECFRNRYSNAGSNQNNSPTNRMMDFSKLRPYHVKDIIRMIKNSNKAEQQDPYISADSLPLFPSFGNDDKSIVQVLQETLSFVQQQKQQEQYVDDIHLLNHMVQTMQEIQIPYTSFFNITAGMMRVSSTWRMRTWNHLAHQIEHQLIIPQLNCMYEHNDYYHCMEELIEKIETKKDTNSDEYDQESVRLLLWSAKHLLRERDTEYLSLNSNRNNESNHNNNVNDDDRNYRRLTKEFADVKHRLINLSTPIGMGISEKSNKATILADMYQYIVIQKALNKYQQEQPTSTTTGITIAKGAKNSILYPDSLQYLHDLNYTLAKHLGRMIQQIFGVTKDGTRTPLQQKYRHDVEIMIRLEDGYVTLDGALHVLFHLTKDLFGITVLEDEESSNKNSKAWNKSVRLFHMYDDNDDTAGTMDDTFQDDNNTISDTTTNNKKRYIGSFYLDPFRRKTMMQSRYAMPLLLPSSQNGIGSGPVVAVRLEIEPRIWSKLPVDVSWDDCESLFHEMGHVYQYIIPSSLKRNADNVTKQNILSTTNTVSLRGSDNMQYDFEEFLPQFMVHCLNEKSTIFALITMSKRDNTFSREEIEAAFRVRTVFKARRLAIWAYQAELELQLFTKFDVTGKDESMMELQHRLASEFMLYDRPSKDDISILLEIFQNNTSGYLVAEYRYLWCDCLSALAFKHIQEQYERSNRDGGKTNDDGAGMRQIRMQLRKYLLEPGAAIDMDAFLRAFRLKTNVSADALLELYGLANSKKVSQDNEDVNESSVVEQERKIKSIKHEGVKTNGNPLKRT